VTRDLPDGGASIFAATIRAVRRLSPGTSVEVLIPDFQGSHDALAAVMAARPDVLNHNIETVPRLYRGVRPKAVYGRSLELLARAGEMDAEVTTKSGLMVGLGEEYEELLAAMADLAAAGCQVLTIGQYLQPTARHRPVARYYHPD
jgi:lipoic acid synthetase